ncbi:MAG: hypothetical protein ACJAZ3_001520 [Sphingobacteriales bacterium]|jgi:hypothetical protein
MTHDKNQLVAALLLPLIFLAACSNSPSTSSKVINENPEVMKADSIINESILKGAYTTLASAEAQFVFRKYSIGYKQTNGEFVYTRVFKNKAEETILDSLTNSNFSRTINGAAVNLSEKEKNSYGNSVNSVIYFAFLPYRLNDEAVTKLYLGEETIKDKTYHKIKVDFSEEGGGDDFDDEFLYWFSKDSLKLDYFAYTYANSDTGIRFREAYNRRAVSGIDIQDYNNYKADITIDFLTIGTLFEKGELELLSKIELEDVVINPTRK